MPKRCEYYDCATTLELLCSKNCFEKNLLFKKWEHFENGQNWRRRKGYSLCKTISFGQKLKMPKRCEKRFYYYIGGVVFKKPLRKRPNIKKLRAFWKWAKLATMHGLKAFANWSVCVQNLKMPKRCEYYDSATTLELSCAKNCFEKHLLFEKWDYFQNGQNWPRRKGYSLWKMISLCSRIKNAKNVRILRFCYHVGVVLCKKLLRKTPSIQKMRAFWKWPKLATTQRL